MTDHQTPTTTPDPNKFESRLLVLGFLCLLVVVLVMALSLVYATTIAGSAQDSAERQQDLNDELRSELTCRAAGATDFDLASGHLQASIGEALLVLGQNNDEKFAVALENIQKYVDELNEKAKVREQTLTICTNEATTP